MEGAIHPNGNVHTAGQGLTKLLSGFYGGYETRYNYHLHFMARGRAGTGQAIGRIGDKDTTILKLQQIFCPVSQYLHLFSCYFIFLFGRYLTYLYLIFLIREMELLLSHRIIVKIKCINTCNTLRIVILETSNVSMK